MTNLLTPEEMQDKYESVKDQVVFNAPVIDMKKLKEEDFSEIGNLYKEWRHIF